MIVTRIQLEWGDNMYTSFQTQKLFQSHLETPFGNDHILKRDEGGGEGKGNKVIFLLNQWCTKEKTEEQ